MPGKKLNISLEARDLTIGYQSNRIKTVIGERLNFQLFPGTLTALVGANGVGKSTLIRTLTTMQKPLSGTVSIMNQYIQTLSPLNLARLVSIVLTETPASKNLSVLELVSLGRQPYTNWNGTLSEKDKQAVSFAFKITEIESLASKKCYELSDGQMQRVTIARALAQDTPVIILDEPTTHLDIYHRAYILKLLQKLANEYDKTILFSTHEIDLAIQLSDSILLMTENEYFFDSPETLIQQGHFNKLFPADTILFDKDSRRFFIK